MTSPLAHICLTPDTAPPGLEKVCANPSDKLPLDEQVAIRQACHISNEIVDYVFFRRFADGRSAQVAAYIIDNTTKCMSEEDLATLHRKLWLSGATPLLYVAWIHRVDILTCAAHPVSDRKETWIYTPADTVHIISTIDAALTEKTLQYSAYRLLDGTFWEDNRNLVLFNPDKSAHTVLIEKVMKADVEIEGGSNPLARRLLLLSLLIKYLEDRNVFPQRWFAKYQQGAKSFLDVLENAPVESALNMIRALEEKFDGDIFALPNDGADLTESLLRKLASVVDAKIDRSGQRHFWDIYSFEVVPVEVLSYIYQYFAEKDKGAFFTPPLLVNFILDQVMPLNGTLTGNETVFDPTCGSGIFLVTAFKRLIYVWREKNNWQRPTPNKLKKLLKATIFGVELQAEALDLTAFSLALAICDALLPDIIWNELRFDKLKNCNLFQGDFIDQNPANIGYKDGFDIIVGNPPFISKTSHLTPSMKTYGIANNIPLKNSAYSTLDKVLQSYLKPGGLLCMVQPAGLMYSQVTEKFRKNLLATYKTLIVFDFVSIRKLFSTADTRVVALLIEHQCPPENHIIEHWTFRRTWAAKNRICFELDYYDFNSVSQINATEYEWVWRSNLLGGGRLIHLAKRLKQFQNIKNYCRSNNWDMREGFTVGSQVNNLSSLSNLLLLPTESLDADGIDYNAISMIDNIAIRSSHTVESFQSPQVLIHKTIRLHSYFWNNGALAYKDKIVGIKASARQAKRLEEFHEFFALHKQKLVACLALFSIQIFNSMNTVASTRDVELLPWPHNGNWELTNWEEMLLQDISEYLPDFICNGQDSKLLSSSAQKKNMESYCSTFVQLMKIIYPQIHACGDDSSEGMQLQAFCLDNRSSSQWILGGNILHKMRDTIFKDHNESLRTMRIMRIYDDNTIIFIKPNRLRYWINSVAIRDVDEIIGDVMHMARHHG